MSVRNALPNLDNTKTPPVVHPVYDIRVDLMNLEGQNQYEVYDRLYRLDYDLRAIIDTYGVMCMKSYNGVAISGPDGDMTPEKMSDTEKIVLETGRKIADDLNFRMLFDNLAVDLMKYGDVVDQVVFSEQEPSGDNNLPKGVSQILPWPMQYVTAIDDKARMNERTFGEQSMISAANFYVLYEHFPEAKRITDVQDADDMIHITLNSRRSIQKDNLNRSTFGIWSTSMLEEIKDLVKWKYNIISNDIIWRHRMLPREHHKLNMDAYSPDKFSGTRAERNTAAKSAALDALQDYGKNIQVKQSDQGFITDDGVSIGMVEPKSTTYSDPNRILMQIEAAIGRPFGVPPALIGQAGGSGGGFTAIFFVGSFAATRAEMIVERIRRELETKVLRRHVSIMHDGVSEDILNRLYIRTNLIMERDKSEVMRRVAIMYEGPYTPSEIRRETGLDPLTDEQRKEIKKWRKMQQSTPTVRTSSEKELVADVKDRRGVDTDQKPPDSEGQRDNDTTV
tara:strand:- start:1546 stop:3066 length:1521 start_codon:yes stop_codon:yes gene_type:complete